MQRVLKKSTIGAGLVVGVMLLQVQDASALFGISTPSDNSSRQKAANVAGTGGGTHGSVGVFAFGTFVGGTFTMEAETAITATSTMPPIIPATWAKDLAPTGGAWSVSPVDGMMVYTPDHQARVHQGGAPHDTTDNHIVTGP